MSKSYGGGCGGGGSGGGGGRATKFPSSVRVRLLFFATLANLNFIFLVSLLYRKPIHNRHRHTKDEPLHGVGERLAALLKKAKEDTQKKQTKNKKVRLDKVEKISNRTRTLLGNFVALPPPLLNLPPQPPTIAF